VQIPFHRNTDSTWHALQTAQRLKVLDAFRAVAILAVLLHHYLVRWAPPDYEINLYGYQHVYSRWLDLGALGVQFFFMISGFVIFMTLEHCKHAFEFWLRRVARLYPAYLVCTAITFVTANILGPRVFFSSLGDFLASLDFLAAYIQGRKFVEPAVWSLVVEIQFYFIIGVIFAFAKQRVIAVWICFLGVGLVLWCLGRSEELHVFRSIAKYVFLLPYMPQFTAGMVFYRMYSGRRSGCWGMSSMALLTYATVNAGEPIATHFAQAVMIGCFVFFFLGYLKWLAIRPLVFIGNISYPLYLIHQYVGVSLIRRFTLSLGLPDLAAAFGAASICALVAYAVTRTIEIPAKQAILKWAVVHVFPSLHLFPTFELPRARIK
jgi:peptidoglycan/LPS O-acetylase OafA/YrhL